MNEKVAMFQPNHLIPPTAGGRSRTLEARVVMMIVELISVGSSDMLIGRPGPYKMVVAAGNPYELRLHGCFVTGLDAGAFVRAHHGRQ